jgi:hypothetical protein
VQAGQREVGWNGHPMPIVPAPVVRVNAPPIRQSQPPLNGSEPRQVRLKRPARTT